MKKNILALLLSITFLILYRVTSFSKITFGDSLGKILDIEKSTFNLETYSITHFLYQNFTVLIYKIFPFVDPIEIGRWVNICCAVAVLVILFYTIHLLFNKNSIALLGTLIFGFSFTFWKNTANVEVYTFSLLWIISYIYWTIVYLQKRKTKHLIYAGIILGISFFSHIQGILLIASYLYLCWINYRETKEIKSNLSILFIPFLFLASLYIYPLLNQESIKNVLSSSTQTWVTDTYAKPISSYGKDVVKAIGFLVYNFWFMNLLVIFLPFRSVFKNQIILFLIILCIPIFCFSTIYAVSDNYVFFLNFNLGYTIILCFALSKVLDKNKYINYLIIGLILFTPIYYTTAKQLILTTKQGKQFHQEKQFKGGLDYYMTPWLNNNIGVLEVYLNQEESIIDIEWMQSTLNEYIDLKSKTLTREEISRL